MTAPVVRRRWLVPVLLSLLGFVCALIGVTGALMLFPERLIGPTNWLSRSTGSQTLEVFWKPSDGDIFAALPGQVRPPPDDSPYAAFEIAWDADGFRKEAASHAAHPVAVFGDSFTEGFNVQFPYADRLAGLLGVGVQNYGYRAYGPVEVAETAAEFARAEPRDWVIWGYFSGNDLGDALRSPRVETSNPLAVWAAFLAKARPTQTPPSPALGDDGQPRYNMPVPVIIGANYYDMAFVSYYGWWQQTPPDARESRNVRRLVASLDAFDSAAAPETCRALVFIPPKELIYTRYIYPSQRGFINATNQRIALAESGVLVFAPAPIASTDEAAYFDSLYAHRNLVRGLIGERPGWAFIDLTPAFERAASEGALLYYPYDTHWTQAGHDLAAQVIAERLALGC